MIPLRLPRPRVLRDIPLDRHAVIDASAGTGKTFTIEHLVVELLLATDATIDRVLILTFTDKATHELRTRVRAKLEGLQDERSSGAEETTGASEDAWIVDRGVRGKIIRAAHSFDGATITTIHGFCERILRENAFASGRLFDERPTDGRGAFGRAVRETLRREAADSQRAPWIEAALRSGSSVPAIEELLWHCVQARGPLRPELDGGLLLSAIRALPAEEVQAIDWTAELKGRTHPSTARSVRDRLHALAAIVERAQRTGDVAEYVRDADRVKARHLIDPLGSLSLRPGAPSRLVTAALALVRATPTFSGAVAQVLLPAVEQTWMRAKRDAGQYDFDDMLSLVDEALRGPAGPSLAREMRRRWRYALIDEFQDTDATQWSIFRRAFMERTDGDPPGSVFVVGDPKQSIYRFRGADVQTYLRARDEVVASGGKRVALKENYRATAALVEATNALFDAASPNPLLSAEIAYAPITCGRPERALVDGGGEPLSPVHVLRFREEVSGRAMGAAIAKEITAATHAANPWRFDGRALQLDDVFVLTRSAREGRAIGEALREADIAYSFFKEEGLFQSDQAKDLRVLLAAIDDPDDRACRLAAWLTPFFGLLLADLEKTRDLPIGHPLVERLRSWRALADERRFDRMFESIVVDSGILRREIFFAESERALTNTVHVIDSLLERTREGHTTLRDLASELGGLIAQTRLPSKLEGNVQRLDGDRRAVQIMTIHKAKGLEAPLVFVAGGLSRGRTDGVRIFHEGGRRVAWAGEPSPEARSVVKREEGEEDERLMYVALTRAMGRLVLPCVVDDASTAKRLTGPYDRVNRRVVELLEARAPGFAVSDPIARPATTAHGSDVHESGAWRPSPALLRDDGPAHEALRARHGGAVLTSYTRMAAARAAKLAATAREPDHFDASPTDAGAVLRAGRGSGIFLHELLERVSLATLRRAGDIGEWRELPDVREVFDETMGAHRVEPDQRADAERLVWAAYRTPVDLPGGERIESLASATLVAREMNFLYLAGASGAFAQTFVRGAIDVAFTHGSLTYLLDWKSDTLRSYEEDALSRRVEAHYLDQMKLYTLAVAKLLGIQDGGEYDAHFGGLLICFVRGFDRSGRGVWRVRPSWSDVLAFGEEVTMHRGAR